MSLSIAQLLQPAGERRARVAEAQRLLQAALAELAADERERNRDRERAAQRALDDLATSGSNQSDQLVGERMLGTARLSVWSRQLLERVKSKSFGLDCPSLADELKGSEAPEGFEPSAKL